MVFILWSSRLLGPLLQGDVLPCTHMGHHHVESIRWTDGLSLTDAELDLVQHGTDSMDAGLTVGSTGTPAASRSGLV